MKKYERPVVLVNEDLAEGVYAASGKSCWTANGAGKQTAVSSRGDFRFQINGVHHGEERHAASVYITFTFDQMVKEAEFCGYPIVSSGLSAGTKIVTFELTNLSGGVNPTENFGGGALNVKSLDESLTSLELISVVIVDGGC